MQRMRKINFVPWRSKVAISLIISIISRGRGFNVERFILSKTGKVSFFFSEIDSICVISGYVDVDIEYIISGIICADRGVKVSRISWNTNLFFREIFVEEEASSETFYFFVSIIVIGIFLFNEEVNDWSFLFFEFYCLLGYD